MGAWGHHVQRRGGIYHLRVRVPHDLRTRLRMREIRKSLQTANVTEAKARAAKLYARLHQALSDIRQGAEAEVIRAALGRSEQAPARTRQDVSPFPTRALAPRVVEFLDQSYLAEKRLGEDSRRHIVNYVRLFAKVTGDKPLDAYTRADVVSYVRTLERLRWTLGKDPRDYGRPLDDLLRQSEGQRCMSSTTVEKHLTHVRALFLASLTYYRFASEGDVKAVFAPVPLSDFVPKASYRGIWQVDTLNKLFASPIWSGTASEPKAFRRRHVPGENIHKDAYWWLPILGLYTGARLEELAQLHHEDLKRDRTGIAFLDINEEGVRRLKNMSSARCVPVHSMLIDLGLLELFRPGRDGLVFPELRPHGRMGKLGGLYTVHFTRYRREIGVYEAGLDFHAFRHTAISRLGEREVPGLKIARLAGHMAADPDEARTRMTRRYSHYDISSLRDSIERLEYPGLDLGSFRRGNT